MTLIDDLFDCCGKRFDPMGDPLMEKRPDIGPYAVWCIPCTKKAANQRCGGCRDLSSVHTNAGDCWFRVVEPLTPTTEGIAAIPDHMRGLQSILEEVRTLMYDRGRKYGPGNIAEFGELGLLVRLSDKLARLRNNQDDFGDESVDDTVLDVVGYGLIWLLWRKGEWPQ